MASGIAKESLSRLYKDFVRVCEKWPIDSSRKGRDLGEHVKNNLGHKFKEGKVDHLEAERTLNALMKISTNHYKNKYPRLQEIGYTTQALDNYKTVLSNDGQNQVEPHRTWWERFSMKKKIGERIKENMEK